FAARKAAARETRKTRDIALSGDQITRGLAACAAARDALAKTARGQRAPFAECVVSTESKALRHLFFAEREVAKIPDVPKDTPTLEIRRAAVVCAGTM